MPITPERASQTSHIPFPDFKGTKRWLGRMSTPLALSILAACGAPDVRAVGGNLPIPTVAGNSSEVNAQNTAIAGANTTSAANEASATAIAGGKIPPEGTQIPTSKPEVKKEILCGILSPEVCATVELIELPPNPEGQSLRYVGLNPPANTELFMPIKGQIVKVENPKGFNGFRAVIFQTSNLRFAYDVTGDIGFKNKLTENKDSGQPFAVVQDTGIENYGYRVLITASGYNDKDQTVTSDTTLKELFPQLYTVGRSPKKVVAQIPSNSGATKSSPIFLPRN